LKAFEFSGLCNSCAWAIDDDTSLANMLPAAEHLPERDMIRISISFPVFNTIHKKKLKILLTFPADFYTKVTF
jgi:hypothetical protein